MARSTPLASILTATATAAMPALLDDSIFIGKLLDVHLGPDFTSSAAAIFVLMASPSQWFQTKPQNKYHRTLGHRVLILLLAVLGLLLSYPLAPAYASSQAESPQEQFLAQQQKMDQTIVQPCKSERMRKAPEIRAEIE